MRCISRALRAWTIIKHPRARAPHNNDNTHACLYIFVSNKLLACMYVCICVCTYVRMYICMYIVMWVCSVYAYMYVYAYVRMYVCTYVRICVCTYVRTYLCVCTYVCMCVCMFETGVSPEPSSVAGCDAIFLQVSAWRCELALINCCYTYSYLCQ